MPSDSAWPQGHHPERRLSNSSDGSAGSGYSKPASEGGGGGGGAEFAGSRAHSSGVQPGRPAANPLQFVRVGPAPLGRHARDQLSKAHQATATRATTHTQEDWQSNLDNWKSSRRKRVEHIIERCVEVKRMEHEGNQPRGKSKTFNEMLEERAGRRRLTPLTLYTEDDGHDLSDLGIGTSSTKSSLSEDCDTHSLASDGIDLDKNHSDVDNLSNCGANRKTGSSANEYDTCTTTTISSPEPEEYTYEGAIEGYKSRIISQANSGIVKTLVDKEKSPEVTNGDLNRIRTSVSIKIEEKISSFQQDKISDVKNNNQKNVMKFDILKRREQFERENSQESLPNKPKLPDIANKKSIKERLSSLEKFTEESQKSSKDVSKLPTEVLPLKERLSSLEKVKSGIIETDKNKKPLNSEFTTITLKQRLSTLNSQTSEDDIKVVKSEPKEIAITLKERLNCLETAKNKEIPKISLEETIIEQVTINTKDLSEQSQSQNSDNSLKSSLSGIENQMQSFCRSLDSLDINGQSSPSSFGRVQSLEDFDGSDIQNNNAASDIETEDSGIHTARDSCAPADDIADLTQVASPISEAMIEPSEYDSSNEENTSFPDAKTDEPLMKVTTIVHRSIIQEEPIEVEEHDVSKAEDTDSGSYLQARSQLTEELSAADEITEIHLDNDDEDTLKSLENQDTSVIDALELAFKEIDFEELNNGNAEPNSKIATKVEQLIVVDESKAAEVKTELVKMAEAADRKMNVAPLYENVDIFYQNGNGTATFLLDMPTQVLEPPKEKPPPPPVEDSPENDELLGNGKFKHTSSARRIKKEIRNKRTSFLGIEGQVDGSYLDAELTIQRPDITSFLQEESKIDKILYNKTLSQEMDSKLGESRDSGVDVERGPVTPDGSAGHTRQNSEPYSHAATDEDSNKSQHFNEDLSAKLEGLRTQDCNTTIDHLDKKLQEQQAPATNAAWTHAVGDDAHTKEVLRFERELLQLEQEELKRQREHLMRERQRIPEEHRRSMPNLAFEDQERMKRKPFVSEEHMQSHFGVEESSKVFEKQPPRPPQPVMPRQRQRDSLEREITMRNSRAPSGVEYANVEQAGVQLRKFARPPLYHPMTRNTLQALSAAPTPKRILGAEWMQPQRRPQRPPNYNYNNHWLVQEAEQRRIEEQRNRMRPLPPTQRHSYHHDRNGLQGVQRTRPFSASEQQLRAPEHEREHEHERVLSVSGKRKCSHCGEELGRGAAMLISSLALCFHVQCFACGVCGEALGDGRRGAEVRVRGGALHCHHCYSADDGSQYSAV